MVAASKYQDAVEQMWTAIHNLTAAGHVIKVVAHSDAPTLATDDELADLTQQAGSDGYTTGGEDTQNAMTETGGTATWTSVDVVWTASGTWSAMRYISQHNDTSTTDKLLTTYDYGSNWTLSASETFTVDFGASTGTLV